MSESDLYPQIIGAHSHGETRLFRQQSCLAWAGKVLRRTQDTVTLLHPHAIKLGVPGMADIGGLTSIEITEALLGHTLGAYVAIEVKDRGRLTAEQSDFLTMVRSLGGRAGVARSAEQAGAILRGELLP